MGFQGIGLTILLFTTKTMVTTTKVKVDQKERDGGAIKGDRATIRTRGTSSMGAVPRRRDRARRSEGGTLRSVG